MPDPTTVIPALLAEGEDLDRLLSRLHDSQWDLPTPAPGWTVRHQVAHLAAAYRLAGVAAGDPAGYLAQGAHERPGFNAFVGGVTAELLAVPTAALTRRWRAERAATAAALDALPPDREVPWMPTPMTAGVLGMVGLMEAFAHGQDIADAVGVPLARTDRIHGIVRLITHHWQLGYHAHGIPVPDVRLRFEVVAPSGAVWCSGPEDSPERVTGPAVDLCLLATRRRHRDDVAVRATGEAAGRWLDIAQAYRGPAGTGRAPGQFTAREPAGPHPADGGR